MVFDPIHEPPSRVVFDHVDPYFIRAVRRADETDDMLANLEFDSVDRWYFLARELSIDKESGRWSGEKLSDLCSYICSRPIIWVTLCSRF